MTKISDYLDWETKKKIIRDSIRPGRIIHIRALFNDGDSANKLCVVICSEPFLFYTISSHVSKYVRSIKEGNALQIPIDKDDYNCLTQSSFINCIELHSKMELESAVNQINANPNFYRVRDFLKKEHREEIIIKVLASKLYSEIDKKTIVEGLSFD